MSDVISEMIHNNGDGEHRETEISENPEAQPKGKPFHSSKIGNALNSVMTSLNAFNNALAKVRDDIQSLENILIEKDIAIEISHFFDEEKSRGGTEDNPVDSVFNHKIDWSFHKPSGRFRLKYCVYKMEINPITLELIEGAKIRDELLVETRNESMLMAYKALPAFIEDLEEELTKLDREINGTENKPAPSEDDFEILVDL